MNYLKWTKFSTYKNPHKLDWQRLLNIDSDLPHIHIIDMPYRQTSTWQDLDCEIGIWDGDEEILAWALFQPPWWNLDYGIHPLARGSELAKEVFAWGKEQMMVYSKRSGEEFYGSVEFFENTSDAQRTAEILTSMGFTRFDWSTIRFEIMLDQELPIPQLPDGFTIRTLAGISDVDDYVRLHRAAFGSDKMTNAWRIRTLDHPAYRPEIDLVVVGPEDGLVGFCICWMRQDIGQIEPLGIHPDYQGQGLGRALELYAVHTLQKHGLRSVLLDHVSLNEKAIAISMKTGFRQRNNALRYYLDTNLQHKISG
jgi:ribosomal protein S18 acetylase RimI-like enzyme